MSAPESKLDTIRKLLSKAAGAATEHEADAYTRKATELMARHGIDQALLAESGAVADDIGGTRIGVDEPYSRGKGEMLCWIAGALGCRSVVHFTGRKTTGITVFGHASDRERVELLYTSLLLQAVTQLVRARPNHTQTRYFDPPPSEIAAYRRTWLRGFAARVASRIAHAEADARAAVVDDVSTATGTSTALVLVDRTAAVEQAYGDTYGHLKDVRPSKLSGNGYGDGDAAGARASLHSGRAVGARRRTALEG